MANREREHVIFFFLILHSVSVKSNIRLIRGHLCYIAIFFLLFSKLPEDEEDDLRPVGVERSQSTVSRGSQGPGWRANMKGDYDLSSVKPIATKDMLCWAYQVRDFF